jgi:hypothetical protein
VARKQGRYAGKASAQLFRIADFEFFGFSFQIRIPQSAFRNQEGFSLAGDTKIMLERDSVPKVRDELGGP